MEVCPWLVSNIKNVFFCNHSLPLEFFQNSHYFVNMTSLEIQNIFENLDTSKLFGCDCSAANIFLYQKYQNISFEIKNNVFFRYYEKSQDFQKIAFPLCFKNASQDYLFFVLENIIQNLIKTEFCLCTESQTKLIDNILNIHFPEYHIKWESDRSQSDYLYLQEKLSMLQGQTYQKKKNHVLHFCKTYENQWEFVYFDKNTITEKQKNNILSVEENWFREKNAQSEQSLLDEKEIINTAVQYFEHLNLKGAVLYLQNKPVAMTLASPISPSVLDIHFEKSLAEPAKNGAYAAINQLFAQKCSSYKYINREEDLGIPGLRKAKLSYKPDIILDKFSGILEKK